MKNKFYKFLERLEGISLECPKESDIERLQELSSGKLPEMFLEVYRKAVPVREVEYDDFVFYGIERIVDENTDYIPGANLLPLGLFTFASALDGDSICFDLSDTNYPVYQCSHSLVSGESDITYYKGEMHRLSFNYENVIKVAPKLADSFEDFVRKLLSGEVETFSVMDMIEKL